MSQLHILGDWGTSQLRLWWMRGETCQFLQTGPGLVTATSSPVLTLRALLEERSNLPRPASICLCGMAGASTGLAQAPYVPCSAALSDWRRAFASMHFEDIPVRIAAGLRYQSAAGNTEIMRGEETQVFGAIELHPELKTGHHIVVLPGTHSKHVQIVDGCITSFRTFMTGEFYALLSKSSIFATDGPEQNHDSETRGFNFGLETSQTSNLSLLSTTFQARVRQVAGNEDQNWARGFLSGLLLGEEARSLLSESQPAKVVHFIGESGLVNRYVAAFQSFGLTTQKLDADQCTLKGLQSLHAYN